MSAEKAETKPVKEIPQEMPKRPTRPLSANVVRFQEAEFGRTVYLHQPDEGTPIAAILKPEYWVHVARKMKPHSRIEVVPASGAYFLELFIRSVTGPDKTRPANAAGVSILRLVEFDASSKTKPAKEVKEPENATAYEAKWKGPNKKFTVYRTSDNTEMMDGYATKEEAAEYIGNLEKQ